MRAENLKAFAKEDGYSLIELLFTIVVISVGLGSLYAVLFRGMDHMKTIGGKNYAVVAASSELEVVKAMARDELPNSYDGPFLGQVDISTLTDGEGILKIEDYGDTGGRLKKVTAIVKWSAAGKRKAVSVSTIVSKP
jgi:prepilin-type N-terminal cleavage/methylation domain-containing protein